MVQNKKARVQQPSVKTESFEEFIKNGGAEEIRKFGLILSEALQLKEQRLKVNEADRETLTGKVESLETQAKNDQNQIKRLERKVGQIFKLLLLERNKVKRLEEEISILKLDTVQFQADMEKEIESFTEDDDTEEPNRGNPDVSAKSSDEQAKDDDSDAVEEESEDESDEDEPTKDDERVIVKKEVTSDNEDESREISKDRSSTPSMRTEEKLLTETQAEEDGDAAGADDDDDGDREDLDDLLTTAIASFEE